jgi:hypothetical protein
MRWWARLAAAVAVAVTFCVSGTPPAFAAADLIAASRDQIEARRQALLQLMLQDPSNLDVAFEYASLSSQVGDYEAAVSTLTRRPDLEQAGARSLGLVGWKGVAAVPASAPVCAFALFPGESELVPLADCQAIPEGAAAP